MKLDSKFHYVVRDVERNANKVHIIYGVANETLCGETGTMPVIADKYVYDYFDGHIKYFMHLCRECKKEYLHYYGNPNMKLAKEMRKRYQGDVKAGHTDAAEYWRGQAAAYFTGNPLNKLRAEWWSVSEVRKWKLPMLGTIRTVPENYYVADIMPGFTLSFRGLEANTRDINKSMVKNWWSGYLQSSSRSHLNPKPANDHERYFDGKLYTYDGYRQFMVQAKTRCENLRKFGYYARFYPEARGYSIWRRQKTVDKNPWSDVPKCPKCGSKPNYISSHTEGKYWVFKCAKISCGNQWRVLQSRYSRNPIGLAMVGEYAAAGMGMGLGYKAVEWLTGKKKKE